MNKKGEKTLQMTSQLMRELKFPEEKGVDVGTRYGMMRLLYTTVTLSF